MHEVGGREHIWGSAPGSRGFFQWRRSGCCGLYGRREQETFVVSFPNVTSVSFGGVMWSVLQPGKIRRASTLRILMCGGLRFPDVY